MMDEMKGLLQYAFQTRNALTLPVSAPGSAGMETCFANLVEPGDKVIVCINGVFGGRMKENVERYGGIAVTVEDDWGKPVSLGKVEDALKGNPDARLLAFVHAETSTGACSDVKALCELARRHGCLSIVDAVTSLGGSPLYVDDWGSTQSTPAARNACPAPPVSRPSASATARWSASVAAPRRSRAGSWI
jgi:alanine-glyoxylate transaminase / serine-glyoxylate transaminase / serine-pyruvate transaminase